ncbi:MAG: hypothetical protein ACUVRM_05380 [Bacillota bacterium]
MSSASHITWCRLRQLLGTKAMTLIASLPENSADLARAAIEGGADVIKVHINVVHHASKTCFGTLEEEMERLLGVLEVAGDVPVGIVPGGRPGIDRADLAPLIKMGFDFISAYAAHLSAACLTFRGIGKMVALDPSYRLEEAAVMANMGVDVLEASIIPPEGYGDPLTAADVLRYAALVRAFGGPVVVPTQRNIRPADVPALMDAGVRGLMIGAVVGGKDPVSFGTATKLYRQVIDGHER